MVSVLRAQVETLSLRPVQLGGDTLAWCRQDWVCAPALLRKREQSSLFPELGRNQDEGNERVFDVFAKER